MPATMPFMILFDTSEVPELGPGPRASALTKKDLEIRFGALFRTTALSADRQRLLRSLALLWHDQLDDAHAIAQTVEDPDGAFVHGIVHRREPDYGNAAYWFRRTGLHPAFAAIAQEVSDFLKSQDQGNLCNRLVPGGEWDPFAFINACQEASANENSQDMIRILREVQRIEMERLLHYFCTEHSGA
jgi:hypothetical protein